MAITTLDGAIAGALPPTQLAKVGAAMKGAGILHSLFYSPGIPGAAAAPSPGINGAALTTYAGQIPFTNPGAGNSYLLRFGCVPSFAGALLLLDRLWHNSGLVVTTTTAQAITPVAIPARDADGATAGNGVRIAIEVSTATTNAGAVTNLTASYTNSAGTAGRTATMSSFPATANAGTFVEFQLQAGDVGVRSVESVTLGTSLVSGTIHLVLFRQLATAGCAIANQYGGVDAVSGGFVRMYNNTVPFVIWNATITTAITIVAGDVTVTQG